VLAARRKVLVVNDASLLGGEAGRRCATPVESMVVAETYPSGLWVVKPGEKDAFVQAWTDFATGASTMPGSGAFGLVRDLDGPSRYMSLAPWPGR